MKKFRNIWNTERQCNVFVNFELKTKLSWLPEMTYFEHSYIEDIWLFPYPTEWQKNINNKKIKSALEDEICKKAFLTPDGYTLIHIGWKTINCVTELKGTIDHTNED